MRYAHNVAFFLIYIFDDFISFSTSDAKSFAISGDAIAPNVHNARPTMNCILLFKSLEFQEPTNQNNYVVKKSFRINLLF